MSFTHTVRKALARLRYPDVDANGNLVASVSPRRDTLANLLNVADGGDGELALATDEDTYVVYSAAGTPDFTFYPNKELTARSKAGVTLLAAGTTINFPLASVPVFDPYGLIDNANDILLFPSRFQSYQTMEFGIEIQLHCIVALGSVAPTFNVQAYDGSTWSNVTNPQLDVGLNIVEGAWFGKLYAGNELTILPSLIQGFRVEVTSNDTVDQYLTQSQLMYKIFDAK